MAGKIFEVAFKINGQMSGTFSGAMAAAGKAMGQLKNQSSEVNAAQRRLEAAWKQSQQAAAQYQAEMSRLTAQYQRGQVSQSQYVSSMSHIQSQMASATMSASQYRSELNRLNADMTRIQSTQQRLQTSMGNFNSATSRMSNAWNDVGATMAKTAAVSAPFVGMIGVAASFEKSMAKVKAITNSTEADMQKLTNQAKELGSTTQYSASQAADAMSYLGLAGWNTNSIMGAMPGLLSLAAASGTDLARVADIISDDMTGFGIAASNADGSVAMFNDRVSNAEHFADVFAYTMSHTNTTVDMLGETMKYAAPVAKAFGATLEETSALAGLMANAGIKASQAGTSLRAGFLRLAGPPKKASKAMDELGISLDQATTEAQEAQQALAALGIETQDVTGEQKKMAPLLTEIRNKTAGLTKEQKLATLGCIFGTEAASGWLAVLSAEPGVFEQMVEDMEKSDGTAAKMAETMQNTALGALTALKSAAESVAINIGAVFLPKLAELGRAAAKITGDFAQWAGEHPQIISMGISIAGLAGGALIAAKGFIALTETVNAARTGLQLLSSMRMAETVAGMAPSGGIFGNMFAGISTAFSNVLSKLSSFGGLLIGKITTPFKAMGGIFRSVGRLLAENMLTPFMGKITTFFSGIGGKIMPLLMRFIGPLSAAFAPLTSMLAGPLSAAFGGVIASFGGLAAAALPIIGIIAAIVAVGAILYSNWETIANVAQVVWDKVQACWGAAMERLQPAFESIGQSLDRLGVTFSSFGGQSAILETIFNTLGSVIAASFMVGITAIEVFVNAFAGAFEIISTTINEIGVIIQALAEGDWAAAWNSMGNIVSTVVSGIISTVSNMVSSVINGIKSIMGMSPSGGGGGGVDVSSNAYGGIYKQGAFLTTFAEDSPEAAIPLDGSPRAMSLWQQAGQMLGIMPEKQQAMQVPNVSVTDTSQDNNVWGYLDKLSNIRTVSDVINNSSNSQNVTISIPVNISGNADSSTIATMQTNIIDEVKRALEEIQNHSRRVSFA